MLTLPFPFNFLWPPFGFPLASLWFPFGFPLASLWLPFGFPLSSLDFCFMSEGLSLVMRVFFGLRAVFRWFPYVPTSQKVCPTIIQVRHLCLSCWHPVWSSGQTLQGIEGLCEGVSMVLSETMAARATDEKTLRNRTPARVPPKSE